MAGRHGIESQDEDLHDELARTKEENAHLKVALRSRTVIGQATGLLMATMNMSQDDAFAELTKVSSYANRKVRDIAAEVVAAAVASSTRDRTRPLVRRGPLPPPSDVGPDGAQP